MALPLLCKDTRRLLANMLMCRRCQMDPNCTSEICDFKRKGASPKPILLGLCIFNQVRWQEHKVVSECFGAALTTFPIATSELHLRIHLHRNSQVSPSLRPLEEMSESESIRRRLRSVLWQKGKQDASWNTL